MAAVVIASPVVLRVNTAHDVTIQCEQLHDAVIRFERPLLLSKLYFDRGGIGHSYISSAT